MKINKTTMFRQSAIASALLMALSGVAHASAIDSGANVTIAADTDNTSAGVEGVFISATGTEVYGASSTNTRINTLNTASTNIGNSAAPVVIQGSSITLQTSGNGNNQIFSGNGITDIRSFGTNSMATVAANATTVISGVTTNTTGVNIVGNTNTITGATNINTTGAAGTTLGSATSATTVGGTLAVSGATTSNGITNTGNISTTGNSSVGGNQTVTGTTTLTGATTSNGITNTGNISTTGNSSVGGNQTVTGTLGVTGATTLGNTLSVTGQSTTNGIANTGLIANTGNLTNSGNATFGTVGTSTNTLQGATNTITGTTNINTTGGTTNIGTGAVATTNSIGNSLSTNTIMGTTAVTGATTVVGTTNINATSGANTTIGTASASTNTIQGATNTITGVSAGSAVFSNNTGAPTGVAGQITVYNAAQPAIAAGASIGDKLAGKTYQNKISGNTLVDGNVMINGTLSYVSNNTATTQVVDTQAPATSSVLTGATQAVVGTNEIVAKGQTISTATKKDPYYGTAAQAAGAVAQEASNTVTLTNGAGNTHGLAVYENRTVLSGGTTSSNMSLDNNGAHFYNQQTGAPVRVTGVADGVNPYDAVNVRQLNDVAQRAYSGIAQVTAMANIPGPIAGKNYSIGVGTGYYRGNTALAIGAKANIGNMIQLQGSVGTGFGYTDSMAAGGGVSFSW